MRRSPRGIALGSWFIAIAALNLSPLPAAAESRSFVVSWFHIASGAWPDACPRGLNLDSRALARRNLASLGYSAEEIAKMVGGQGGGRTGNILENRGRINGKPVNVFTYPWSVPDPNILTVEGKNAYGFDLDGAGPTQPGSFTDPETGVRGVDNQLYRVLGCFGQFFTALPDRPTVDQNMWDRMIDSMPAWVLTVTGEDLSRDGDVTVRFDRALNHPLRDAQGEVLADLTFMIDPNPRSQNTLRGHIREGVLTVTPAKIEIETDPAIVPELLLERAQMRLSLSDNGFKGYLGGYTPWFPQYWRLSIIGGGQEESGMDMPGYYYALKKFADSSPDPKTGENTMISAAFRLEGVRGYVASASKTNASDNP